MSHSNTVLSQLLNLIDRHDFQQIENEQFQSQRKYRVLSRWGQFTTMMFAQITGRVSLRDISDSLQTQAGRLYHLGIGSVKKSTLADANNRRPTEFFQAFFEKSYQRCAVLAPGKKKFKFKNKLYSLDASTIDLCLSVFPWAKFRTTKGGIKLHALLDHDGYIPAFASITDAKTSDLAYARTLTLHLAPLSQQTGPMLISPGCITLRSERITSLLGSKRISGTKLSIVGRFLNPKG